MYNVLICDDQPDIVNALKIYLKSEGYRLFTACNGAEALELMQQQEIHLVILDVMMPVMDGITATAKIREFSNIPIILLTAKSETEDMVEGLNAGADDYITKPFNILELKARIKAILRRVTSQNSAVSKPTVSAGGIELDYNLRRVKIGNKVIELTAKEFDLCDLFVSNPGKVYSRENLLDIVWGYDYPGDIRTVDVHVRRLRETIEPDAAVPT